MRSRIAFLLLLVTAPCAVAADPLGPRPEIGQETRSAVISLLRENRQKYGDDAAIMQGLLLVHATAGDAILATEVAIVGFEETPTGRFVAFRVESGAIFDDRSTNREERLERVWHAILERTLRRYPTFDVPGDGIAVEIRYSHRPFESMAELYRTIDEPGATEIAKFYLRKPDIRGFLRYEFEGAELLARSSVLLDDQPVRPVVQDFVGPLPPRTSIDPGKSPY